MASNSPGPSFLHRPALQICSVSDLHLPATCRQAQPPAVESFLTLQQLQCTKTSFTAFASFAHCLVFRSHNRLSFVQSSLLRIAALPLDFLSFFSSRETLTSLSFSFLPLDITTRRNSSHCLVVDEREGL